MAVKDGQTVHVHYTGTLSDGSQFDSSMGRAPLEFTVGEGSVIKGFDDAVRDLEVGQSKTVTIPAAEAYGERTDEAIQSFPIGAFPETPRVGWVLELQTPEGQRVPATVVAVRENEADLDFNHPLAGQDLTFEIELIEVLGEEGGIILP